MTSLITGKYSTVTPSINLAITFLVVLWTVDRGSNRQIHRKHFSQVPLPNNLVDTFETMLPYLSIDLAWLLCKSKEGDGFQGWHKDFYMGGQITKTIVINVGTKVINHEETTRSFDVSFEVDD